MHFAKASLPMTKNSNRGQGSLIIKKRENGKGRNDIFAAAKKNAK
jgi:hypothetical protein